MTDSEALYIARNYIELLKKKVENLENQNKVEQKLCANAQLELDHLKRITSEDKIEVKKDIRVQEQKKQIQQLEYTISKLRKDNSELICKNIQLEKKIAVTKYSPPSTTLF